MPKQEQPGKTMTLNRVGQDGSSQKQSLCGGAFPSANISTPVTVDLSMET